MAQGGESPSGVPYVRIGDKRNTAAGWHRVAELAASQHGIASRDQLRRLGLSDRQIAHRIASGYLHVVLPRVYAVGHGSIGRRGSILAAVLACGIGTVVSHRAAAELLGIWDKRAVLVDVISGNQSGRRIQGICWHRAPYPLPDEIGIVDGIPCTSVARTIVDLAGMLGDRSLRQAVEQAAVRGTLDLTEMDRAIARAARRRGIPTLRSILSTWRPYRITPKVRSRLESKFLRLAAEAGLSRPAVNAVLVLEGHRLEIDFLWEEERLAIETDGEETHGTPAAFQRDRWRDQVLLAAGYRSGRVTWRQIADEPAGVIMRIRRTLAG